MKSCFFLLVGLLLVVSCKRGNKPEPVAPQPVKKKLVRVTLSQRDFFACYYDERGRLTYVDYRTIASVNKLEYKADGQITEEFQHAKGSSFLIHTLDGKGRVVNTKTTKPIRPVPTNPYREYDLDLSYTYDNAGRLTATEQKMLHREFSSTGPGRSWTDVHGYVYNWDAQGRVISSVKRLNGTIVEETTYENFPSGRLSPLAGLPGLDAIFYRAIQSHLPEMRPIKRRYGFRYDDAGNKTAFDETVTLQIEEGKDGYVTSGTYPNPMSSGPIVYGYIYQ